MKKYFNPEYKMAEAMSNDVLTLSHNDQEVVKDAEGNVLYVVDTYRDTNTNEYTGVVSANVNTLLGM